MRKAEELRYLALAIQRDFSRAFAAMLRPLAITPSQSEVIRVLGDFGPLTLTALGKLHISESGDAPSRLVERLSERGLIRRTTDPHDRRSSLISLTAEGESLEKRIKAVERHLDASIDALTRTEQLETMLHVLRPLAGALPAGQKLARRLGDEGCVRANQTGVAASEISAASGLAEGSPSDMPLSGDVITTAIGSR